MQKQSGFSLLELMVAVVILAIIMSFAIPSYRDHVISGRITEATGSLSQGKIRMEQSFQDNRNYAALPCPAPTNSFTFVCTNPGGNINQFLITATGNNNTPVQGFVFTINEQNVKTTTSAIWNVNNQACWLTKKGASC